MEKQVKKQQDTTFHEIPAERKAQIFEHLSFAEKINVSQVCREWAIVVQFTSNLNFKAVLNNDSLKFVAERCCPLGTLKIENWTALLRNDFSLQNLLSPVNEVILKGGISRYNLENLLESDGGTVTILKFQRSFFNIHLANFFAKKPPALKWSFIHTLSFRVPGGENVADAEHVPFLQKLFRDARLPLLSDLSIELGRKLGAEASRINRNGRFFIGTFVPLVVELFRFIAAHKSTLRYLKLFFLLNVLPQEVCLSDDQNVSSSGLDEELLQLNLKRVQVRYYNNNFRIPFVRHLVQGATELEHIEYEQFGRIYPEVFAAIERNAQTLKTVILELRTKEDYDLYDDVYNKLTVLQNCSSLKTLHLRGQGIGRIHLSGIPPSVSTLRLGICTKQYFIVGEGFKPLMDWMLRNLPELTHLEFADPGNLAYLRITCYEANANMCRRANKVSSVTYWETNWFGDYSKLRTARHSFFPGLGVAVGLL